MAPGSLNSAGWRHVDTGMLFGRVALFTRASRGIGAAAARCSPGEGATVVLDRRVTAGAHCGSDTGAVCRWRRCADTA